MDIDIDIDESEPQPRWRRVLRQFGPRIVPLITALSAASALGVAVLHLIGGM